VLLDRSPALSLREHPADFVVDHAKASEAAFGSAGNLLTVALRHKCEQNVRFTTVTQQTVKIIVLCYLKP
jgi:hypothetical protein